jgi:hypothetical protein
MVECFFASGSVVWIDLQTPYEKFLQLAMMNHVVYGLGFQVGVEFLTQQEVFKCHTPQEVRFKVSG